MRKLLFIAGILSAFAPTLSAQGTEKYTFKEVKKLSATPIKSQDQTGTCWAFSTASFLESEVQRMGKAGELNLSEMFVVRHIYRQKCENYVRRQGNAQFGEGGLAHDLMNAVRRYGIVPESEYPGRKDDKPYNHRAIESTLKTMCDGFVAQGKRGELPTEWLKEIDRALDAEFGVVPIQFTANNTIFTPTSYRDYLGINPDDYISLTSFTHHPFYDQFILEVPDNFSNGKFYNLPLNELMRTLNYAIQQGYSIEWDADVSNKGFSAGNGLAIVPAVDWRDKTEAQRTATFKFWESEKNITQEYRQQQFDAQITQDDHLMHITGILDEANSGLYYIVKNSWGAISDLKGYVYVSEAYMRLNTISFMVHKNAVPQDIRRLLAVEAGEVDVRKNNSDGSSNTSGEKQTPPGEEPSRSTRIQKSKPIQAKPLNGKGKEVKE